MKVYVIYAVKSFDCTIDNKVYHCVRAMIGEAEKIGSTWKVKSIKLIKCSNNFRAVELNKPCNIFFDDYGRAAFSQLIND